MDNIFQTVLNMSITGTYIAAAVILLRFAVKKLPKKYSYALWIILGIRLLCPVSFSSAVSFFNLVKPETTENRMVYVSKEDGVYSFPRDDLPTKAEDAPKEAPVADAPGNLPERQMFSSALSYIWAAGMTLMLLYTVISYISVGVRLRGAKHLWDNIYIGDNISSPFVYGIINPSIYLPDLVPENESEFILAHERAHIRRGDHIVKLVAMAALSIHWFNPLMWISYRLMVKDMELSCDEAAVSGFDSDMRKSYAETLLNMSLRQNKIVLGGILGFGESNIKSRIKSVLSAKRPKKAAVAAAFAVIAVSSVCLLTNASAVQPVIDISDYRSFSVCGYSMTDGYSEVKNIDARDIVSLLNGMRLRKISANKAYDIAGNDNYCLRMYYGSECDGEYRTVTLPDPTREENICQIMISDNSSEPEYYALPAVEWAALSLKLTSYFDGISEGEYFSDDGKYTMTISAPESEGDFHFKFIYEEGHYDCSGDMIFDEGTLKSAHASWYMGGGSQIVINHPIFTYHDGKTVIIRSETNENANHIVMRKVHYVKVPEPIRENEGIFTAGSGTYRVMNSGESTALSEKDGRELASLINGFTLTEMSRDEGYYIYDLPDYPTELSMYDVYYEEYMEDGAHLFESISFMSPVHYEDYLSDTKGKTFRYIMYTRHYESAYYLAESEKNGGISLSYENMGEYGVDMKSVSYALSDEDWDKLCAAVSGRFEIFPEGHYVSVDSPMWTLDVGRKYGAITFTLNNGDEPLQTVSPPVSEANGLKLSEMMKDKAQSYRYMGGGIINVDSPALSGLTHSKSFKLERTEDTSYKHNAAYTDGEAKKLFTEYLDWYWSSVCRTKENSYDVPEKLISNADMLDYAKADMEYCQSSFEFHDLDGIKVNITDDTVSVGEKSDGSVCYQVYYDLDFIGTDKSDTMKYAAYFELYGGRINRVFTFFQTEYFALDINTYEDAFAFDGSLKEGADIIREETEWLNTPDSLTRDNWQTPLSDITLPDLVPDENLRAGFLKKCERVAVISDKACGENRAQLAAEYVFKDSSKDADKIYCCELNLRLVSGDANIAEDSIGLWAVKEIDPSRLSEYLTVFDMDGEYLIMVKYGGLTHFYKNIHNTPQTGFEDFRFEGYNSDNLIISDNISFDSVNRTVTDNNSGTVYRFDFETNKYYINS